MIWLDTYWSPASDAPNPTLDACAHPHPKPPSLSVSENELTVCDLSVYLTHTGCGGASVVTRLSSVSLNINQDCGRIKSLMKASHLSGTQCLPRDFRMSSEVLGLHILHLFTLGEASSLLPLCMHLEKTRESLCSFPHSVELGARSLRTHLPISETRVLIQKLSACLFFFPRGIFFFSRAAQQGVACTAQRQNVCFLTKS